MYFIKDEKRLLRPENFYNHPQDKVMEYLKQETKKSSCNKSYGKCFYEKKRERF